MERTLFGTSESEGRVVRSSYKIYISPTKTYSPNEGINKRRYR